VDYYDSFAKPVVEPHGFGESVSGVRPESDAWFTLRVNVVVTYVLKKSHCIFRLRRVRWTYWWNLPVSVL